ncbi:MAG: AAA family ATPase, partial [Dehalococcoidales bacterium]
MIALYIISAEEVAGKTTIAAGIGKHFLSDGKKVGFLKPVIANEKPEGSETDAAFVKQVLALPEPIDSLCPLIRREGVLGIKIRQAYAKASQGKDVVIVEGMCGQSPGDSLSETAYEIAEALQAKVIAVEGFANESAMPRFLNSDKGFGENLLGMILNKVPRSQLKRVCEEVTDKFSESELPILGVLPEDRILFTLTIGELADSIQGEILNNA